MTVVAITGNHPRHVHLATQLAEAGILSGWVVERRAPFMPEPPADCLGRLRELFTRHFEKREEAEARFFGDSASIPRGAAPVLDVTPQTLNDRPTLDFLKAQKPRIVLSYGCHKLSQELIGGVEATFWNTHGGLSPAYRGVTTHFWPSYFLEPQMTGITLHETSEAIDGGAIIHQTAVSMVKGDGLHDLAGRCVKEYSAELPAVLKKALDAPAPPAGVKQSHTGKVWVGADWRPEHLPLIYDHYGDKIVDLVLAGEIKGKTPNLVSVLRGL